VDVLDEEQGRSLIRYDQPFWLERGLGVHDNFCRGWELTRCRWFFDEIVLQAVENSIEVTVEEKTYRHGAKAGEERSTRDRHGRSEFISDRR